MASRPPGILGLLVLRLRFAARRLFNMLVGARPRGDGGRSATARKRNVGAALLLFLPLMLVMQFHLADTFLVALARTAAELRIEADGRIPLPEGAWIALHRSRELERAADELASLGRPVLTPRIVLLHREAEDLRHRVWKREATGRHGRSALVRTWLERGPEGFAPIAAEGSDERRGLLAVFLALWLVAIFLADFGLGLRGAGRLEWQLPWLRSFPVSPAALHVSEIVTGSSFALWLVYIVLPLLWTALRESLSSPAATFWSLLGLVAVLLCLGSIRFLVQLLIWTRLSPSKAKNLQALASALGGMGSLALLMPMTRPDLPGWFRELLHEGRRAFSWLPTDALLAPGAPGHASFAALLPLVLLPAAVVFAVLLAARALTARGLLGEGDGPHDGPRHFGLGVGPSRLGGMRRKECLLLLRDRNLATQCFVLPFGIVAVNFLASPELLPAAFASASHTGALAFGLGAYVLVFSALSALPLEGDALWLLAAMPGGVGAAMREKARLWSVLVLAYPALVFGAAAMLGPLSAKALLPEVLAAGTGLVLFAHLAVASGAVDGPLTAGSDGGRTMATRLRFLLCMALYGALFYLPSPSLRLTWTVLAGLAVLAAWERFERGVPTLLDPTESPPAAFGLGDALGGLAAFVFLQQLVLHVFPAKGVPPVLRESAVFVATGLFVLGGLHAQIRGRGLPSLGELSGLLPDGKSETRWKAWTRGALAGGAVALVGLAWLALLPPLAATSPPRFSPTWWVAAFLLVVAVPLVEELLFRGLLLRRLEALLPPTAALVLAAATFALVHPPRAALPTFLLGLATGTVFRRSGRLSSAVVCHGGYNALLLLASSL